MNASAWNHATTGDTNISVPLIDSKTLRQSSSIKGNMILMTWLGEQ